MTSSIKAFQTPSSSSLRSWNYDIFLSFRGEDVRHKFISHLYQALYLRGINTYMDDHLKGGENIASALFEAIKGSMISIIILSKNYAESRWCLDELVKILDCKEIMKQIVLPIFYEIDPSDVRHQTNDFGKAFAKLSKRTKDSVKVQEWKAALEKVADFSGFPSARFRNESELIGAITQCVDLEMENHTSLHIAKYPVGIESRIQDVYPHLNIGRNDITCIVGIVGAGGIGKTTISKKIYNMISSQFEGSCFLKDVRETSKGARGLIQLQKELLFQILRIRLDVQGTDQGVNVIKHRLRSKRVLLILDDVDKLVQLENLAGDRNWFGLGSRIIITTRDRHLLNNPKADSVYEVKMLDYNEALQLFSWHAFEERKPIEDYEKLSEQVLQYAEGLPLVLTILGSNLKGQSIHQWESAMDKYRKTPNTNIQEILQTSYDGLDDNEKDMFLDIAFFFNGELLANVKKIFDNCDFSPDDGIKRLIEKFLITIDRETRLWMHDVLQDMGREIVRQQSPKELGERSRLWFHKDVRHVLEESTGTNKVEGIVIDLPDGKDMINLGSDAFVSMRRLRVFINCNARFFKGPNYLSNELRVLDWPEYPMQSLPPKFNGKKLIVFRMRNSLIMELGQSFKNLRTMDLSYCNLLTKIPDLSSASNLEELKVEYCASLVEVHGSVGFLDNLSVLSFLGCPNLSIFPKSLKLRSLHELNFNGCESFCNFPEIEGNMENLRTLQLKDTAIEELPLSIGNLVGLRCLDVISCKKLTRLQPNFKIMELGRRFKNLMTMNVSDCNLLTKIPDLSSASNLKELKVEHCASLVEVHDSVGFLDNLSALSFLNCPNLTIFPKSLKLRSLHKLHFVHCESFRNFPEIEGNMENLSMLLATDTAIEELPLSIGNLVGLRNLDVISCKKITRPPTSFLQLSTTLEQLHELQPPANSSNGSIASQVSNLPSCSRSESHFVPLSNFFTMFNSMASLYYLNLSRMSTIVSLPTSIKGFVKLALLHLSYCEKLEEILELPPNIVELHVRECKLLERFPEVNKILQLHRSDIRSLELIDLTGCDKMHVNIWNRHGPNPLMRKGHYHKLSSDSGRFTRLDDVQLRQTKPWIIDIAGPHHLENISGIALYCVAFIKHNDWFCNKVRAEITCGVSKHVCYIERGVELLKFDFPSKAYI